MLRLDYILHSLTNGFKNRYGMTHTVWVIRSVTKIDWYLKLFYLFHFDSFIKEGARYISLLEVLNIFISYLLRLSHVRFCYANQVSPCLLSFSWKVVYRLKSRSDAEKNKYDFIWFLDYRYSTSDFIFCEMYIFIYQIFAIDPSVMIAIYKTSFYLLIIFGLKF